MDKKELFGLPATHAAMTKTHVIVASHASVYVWMYRASVKQQADGLAAGAPVAALFFVS